jgi:hypothetical protein
MLFLPTDPIQAEFRRSTLDDAAAQHHKLDLTENAG